jgi:peptidoglycan/LPS O-acetylase OafA/YrhL
VVVLAHRHFGLAGLAALVVAICFALEAAVATGIMPVDNWMAADTWGAYRAFADFAIGAFVAVLVKDSRWRLRSHLPGWAVFALGVVLMWNGLGGYAALALLAAAIFLAAVAERNNQDGTLVLKPFDALANASFSIYLIHPVAASLMLGMVWRRIVEPLGIVDFYLYWLAPIAMSVMLALLSARYFEAPVARMLNERLVNGGAGRIASRTA